MCRGARAPAHLPFGILAGESRAALSPIGRVRRSIASAATVAMARVAGVAVVGIPRNALVLLGRGALPVAGEAGELGGGGLGRVGAARVDACVWGVRLYKTRWAATAACRGGHVGGTDVAAKASTMVKVGDRVAAFVERQRILEVSAVIEKRVGAPVAATCYIDHSPQVIVKRRQPPAPRRERGMGRPTKRERRQLDEVRERYGSTAVTRAILLGRDPGLTVPLLPD